MAVFDGFERLVGSELVVAFWGGNGIAADSSKPSRGTWGHFDAGCAGIAMHQLVHDANADDGAGHGMRVRCR